MTNNFALPELDVGFWEKPENWIHLSWEDWIIIIPFLSSINDITKGNFVNIIE